MRKSKVEKHLPISNKLWDLLQAYLEWHEGKNAPRSNWKIPEPTYRWRVINGGVVAETMGICLARSTRPREPGL